MEQWSVAEWLRRSCIDGHRGLPEPTWLFPNSEQPSIHFGRWRVNHRRKMKQARLKSTRLGMESSLVRRLSCVISLQLNYDNAFINLSLTLQWSALHVTGLGDENRTELENPIGQLELRFHQQKPKLPLRQKLLRWRLSCLISFQK